MAKLTFPEWSDIERYFKDPELLTSEILFVALTLCNVFVMYRLFLDVVPFPVFVTWWQLAQGLLIAYICGELGREFPKFAYFPRVEINENMLKVLFVPSVFYCIMLVLANYLLYKTPCVATFPVLVSFTVVFHHLTRFIGCGEEYMPLRWQSIVFLLIAFVIGCFDSKTNGKGAIMWAILYGLASAVFRAGFMQKIMHLVEGKGNTLHNNQHFLGVLILPFLVILSGEWRIYQHMSFDFTSLHTWQLWGCLITVGTMPFIKNVISNRLVRRTGQGPWRFLEIVSILLVFLIGISFNPPTYKGYLAIICVIVGRSIGAFDVLLNASDYMMQEGGPRRTSKSPYSKAVHSAQASKPFLSSADNDEEEDDDDEEDDSSFSSNESNSYEASQDYDGGGSVSSGSQQYSAKEGNQARSSSNQSSNAGLSGDGSRIGGSKLGGSRISAASGSKGGRSKISGRGGSRASGTGSRISGAGGSRASVGGASRASRAGGSRISGAGGSKISGAGKSFRSKSKENEVLDSQA